MRLSKALLLQAKKSGYNCERLREIWDRVYHYRMHILGLSTKEAKEDADCVIQEVLTPHEDSETACLDPEVGSLVFYYDEDPESCLLPEDQVQRFLDHFVDCAACQEHKEELDTIRKQMQMPEDGSDIRELAIPGTDTDFIC